MSWKIAAVAIVGLAYIYRIGHDYVPSTLHFLSHLTNASHTNTMATKQKALYLLEPKGQYAVQEKDIPEPGPGEVLVQIHATALNPVDWKIHDYDFFIKEYPAILGTDSSGVIAKLGEGVTTFAVGDKV